MRFHIVCGLVETYVAVLGINEAIWRWKQMYLESMGEEQLLMTYGGCVRAGPKKEEKRETDGYVQARDDDEDGYEPNL